MPMRSHPKPPAQMPAPQTKMDEPLEETVIDVAEPDRNVFEAVKASEKEGSLPSSATQTLNYRTNVKVAENVLNYVAKCGAPPSSIGIWKSVFGTELPPPVATGATLPAREGAAATLAAKMAEAANFATEDYFMVIIRDRRWKADLKSAEWDLRGQLQDIGPLNKLGTGSAWLGKLKFVIEEDGTPCFEYYYQGIVVARATCLQTKSNLDKLRRKLQAIGARDTVTVEPIDPTVDALNMAVRKMWSFSADDFSGKSPKWPLGRVATRMIQLLATVPLHRLCKGYGHGEFHLRAAVDLMKGVASGSGKVSTTNAHPDRRARDILQLARETGFGKHSLPWVKLR
jgi:hypothetical protein